MDSEVKHTYGESYTHRWEMQFDAYSSLNEDAMHSGIDITSNEPFDVYAGRKDYDLFADSKEAYPQRPYA